MSEVVRTGSGRPPVFCTLTTRSYYAQARVLIESLRQNEPASPVYVLVVDSLPPDADFGPRVTVLGLQDLLIDYTAELCFRYSAAELAYALKPSLVRLVLERDDADAVVYLDADCLVMRPLDELRASLPHSTLILMPEILSPPPLDLRQPSEPALLAAGLYSAGFFAVQRSVESAAFLEWWETRVREGAATSRQAWLTLAPLYYPTTTIFRDSAYNMTYAACHERPVSRAGETWLVGGQPLAVFHFTGFDLLSRAYRPDRFNRMSIEPGMALYDLLHHYADLCVRHGAGGQTLQPYPFEFFDNGLPIHQTIRDFYFSLPHTQRLHLGNPFDTAHPAGFFQWAFAPDVDGGLSPFSRYIYHQRQDVQAVYPDLEGAHRAAVQQWVMTHGAAEMGYDTRLWQTPAEAATSREVLRVPRGRRGHGQVWGLIMVRDAVDLVGANILYHLGLGLDGILVLDNGSTDGTTQLLQRLGRDQRVRWFHDSRIMPHYAVMTDLSREAYYSGAEWVVPIDVDEFWYAPGADFVRLIHRSSAAALITQLVNFIQRREQYQSSPEALLTMTRRVDVMAGPADRTREMVESQQVSFVEIAYPPKCIGRTGPGHHISQGNHSMSGVFGEQDRTDKIVCFHAPLHARAALETRVDFGRREVAMGSGASTTWQVKRWLRLWEEGQLEAEWAANSYDHIGLNVYGRQRPLIYDPRLSLAVAPYVRAAAVLKAEALARGTDRL